MSQNQQRNHSFGTLDLIILVVLCGTVSSVVGAAIAGFWQDTRPSRALSAAEAFALQVRLQHENAIHSHSQNVSIPNREPASISADRDVPPLTDGQIGRDPWGRAYRYSVVTGKGSEAVAVVVWSPGPNGQTETSLDALEESQIASFKFAGDDIGYVDRPKAKH